MATYAVSFPPFHISEDPSSVGVRWKRYVSRFQNFLIAYNIRDSARQKAMLLHHAGEEVFSVFETLTDISNDTTDYDTAVDLLTNYFTPKYNVVYERLLLRQAKQRQDESVDTYMTRLRKLASTCDFTTPDEELKTHLIHTCTSDELRRKALQSPDATLECILDMARTLSLSETQASGIEGQLRHSYENSSKAFSTTYNKPLPVERSSPNTSRDSSASAAYKTREKKKCFNCGGDYPHPNGRFSCPANGIQCRACSKVGHYARVCRSSSSRDQNARQSSTAQGFQRYTSRNSATQGKNRNSTVHFTNHTDIEDNTQSFDSDESVFAAKQSNSSVKQLKVKVKISETEIEMLVDTGASVNILPYNLYMRIYPLPLLSTCTEDIYAFGATKPLPVKGTFLTDVTYGRRTAHTKFFILDNEENATHALLSFNTSVDLKVIQGANELNKVEEGVNVKYPDLLTGVEKNAEQRGNVLLFQPTEENASIC